MCACTYACMCACTYAYMRMCVNVCTCVCTRAFTHTHTPLHSTYPPHPHPAQGAPRQPAHRRVQPRPLLVVGPHATHILFTIARFCVFPRSRFIHKFITALPPGGRVRDRMSVNYTLQGLCLRHALNPRRKCVCLS